MKENDMAHLQMSAIDDDLYKALGKRAALANRSISQELIHIIKQYLAQPGSQHSNSTEQLLQLAGTWQDDREAAEIADDIRGSRR